MPCIHNVPHSLRSAGNRYKAQMLFSIHKKLNGLCAATDSKDGKKPSYGKSHTRIPVKCVMGWYGRFPQSVKGNKLAIGTVVRLNGCVGTDTLYTSPRLATPPYTVTDVTMAMCLKKQRCSGEKNAGDAGNNESFKHKKQGSTLHQQTFK